MSALRWFLGLTLFLLSNVFRRSLGASENNPVFALIPLLAAGLLFAAVLYPGARPLLHVAAVAALGLTAFCLWQLIAESAPIMVFGLLYLATWFSFYWMAAGRTATSP